MTANEKIIGGLAEFIAPFICLADRGTSSSREAELEAVRTTIAIIRRPLMSLVAGIETVERLEVLCIHIERMRHAAAMAEELLRRNGWKFDPKKKKVREVAPRKGGDFLASIIRRLGLEYGSDSAGRVKIKNFLAPIFEDYLDSGPRGNIARALENITRTPKPSK